MTNEQNNKMDVKEAFAVVKKLYADAGLSSDAVDLAESLQMIEISDDRRQALCKSWINIVLKPLEVAKDLRIFSREMYFAEEVLCEHIIDMQITRSFLLGTLNTEYPQELLCGMYELSLKLTLKQIKKQKLNDVSCKHILREVKGIKDKLPCGDAPFETLLGYFCGRDIQQKYGKALSTYEAERKILLDPKQEIIKARQIYEEVYAAVLKAQENIGSSLEYYEGVCESALAYRQAYVRRYGKHGLEKLARAIDYYAIHMLRRIERTIDKYVS